eukprot:TRINITY_DN358_c0_g1_i1.p1 TRINITY_DN358_c0_g1~~TRINITY_DN358_c0_g1_i1.p1  ORF type:complete len:509 (+),score=100.76 TRINITY_DN358_c0_g1_i1:90-1616(+)
MLADSQLLQKLLDDFSFVKELFEKSGKNKEITAATFYYFKARGKEEKLVEWAAKEEVDNAVHSSTICRDNTLFTQIVNFQLTNDVGRKYLDSTLVPLVLEIDQFITKYGEMPSSESQVAELLQIISRFHERNENPVLCPLHLRIAYSFLRENIAVKFPEAAPMMSGIIYFRFIAPYITFPLENGLISKSDFKRNDLLDKALLLVSKILICIANGTEFEPGKPHSPQIDKFIIKYHPEFVKATEKLLESSSIDTHRRILSASISKKDLSEDCVDYLAKLMLQYLFVYGFSRDCVDTYLSAEEEYGHLMRSHEAKDWNLKKTEGTQKTYSRKPPHGDMFMLRVETRIKRDIGSVLASIKNMEPDRICGIVTTMSCIKDHCSEKEYSKIMTLPKPFGKRYDVFRRKIYSDDNRIIVLYYSIENDEFTSKYTRIRNYGSGYIIEKVSNNETLINRYLQVDLKLLFPSWLKDKMVKQFHASSKMYKDYMEGISSPTFLEVSTPRSARHSSMSK